MALAYSNANIQPYNAYLDKNEFGFALDAVEKFFWNNFCDNYLELIKDQLFNPDSYTEFELAATRWTLYHVGLRILQMYAPYLPHITENLYDLFIRNKSRFLSIHQTRYANIQQGYMFEESAQLWKRLLSSSALFAVSKRKNNFHSKYHLHN